MTENVTKILKMYDGKVVLSILESKDNYIVSICNNEADIDSATECLYAIDKKTFKPSEFSYFNKPEEYAEACDNILYKHEELTHWGVRGMRWGVRRYQNKDGTLTTAGRKRYNAELAKVRQEEKTLKNRQAVKARMERLAARKKAVEAGKKELDDEKSKLGFKKKQTEDETDKSGKSGKTAKKSIKDMTDEELFNAVNRARLEAEYNRLRPEQIVEKHPFMKKFVDDAVKPAAINAGRQFLQNAITKAGENLLKDKADPNSLEALTKIRDKLKITNEINALKKDPDSLLSWGDRIKKQTWEKNEREREKAAAEEKAASEKAKSDEAARKANESKSWEQYNSSYSGMNPKYSSETINSGKSKTSSTILSLPPAVSSIPSSTKSLGQSRVAGLLGSGSSSKNSSNSSYTEIIDTDGSSIFIKRDDD